MATGRNRKKTLAAIHEEVAREVNQLLGRVFAQRRKDGRIHLEAVECALRTAVQHAGAAVLSELPQFAAPAEEQRQASCRCGQQAQYQEMRSKAVLTIVGPVRISRPYYLCCHCHEGQFPLDVELDIERTDFSPGVRRMQALVGQQAPFQHGREQLKVLAGLEVTAKSVEADIAQREEEGIEKALQLDLPIPIGRPVPILYHSILQEGQGSYANPVTISARIVISADGKTRTATITGTGSKGKKYTSTAVYDKQ